MKLLMDTYQIRTDKSLADYYYTRCPNCNEQLLVGKKGIVDTIKDVPWWLWVVIIVAIAFVDFDFFKWMFIEPAYRMLLLAAGIWVIGFFVAFLFSFLIGIIQSFRNK